MNYLAHALLGDHSPQGLVGALLGDFVKGRADDLERDWPSEVARGIRLHRAIDRFTDAHDAHRRSRNRFRAPRRRFAGIIVDICYDHFLAAGWERFSARPLPEFTAAVYGALQSHHDHLPGRLASIVPRMVERDWLGSYQELPRVGRAIDGVGTRVRGGEAMQGAIEDVQADYAAFQGDFDAFFPELAAFVSDWKRTHAAMA